jgi:hypothetical protein
LSVVGTLGGGYYTGKFVELSSFAFVSDTVNESTAGRNVADYAVADGNASLGLQLEVPTGFVRPYVRASLAGDVLRLDTSDLVFVPDPGQKALTGLTTTTKFQPSIAPGGGLEVALGTDFNIAEHFGLSAELAGYGKVTGLEKIFLQQNVVKHVPLAPLAGVTLLVGVFYEM